MKKIIISGALCSLLMLSGVSAAQAETASTTTTTTTGSTSEMLAKIQQLLKLIADLQTQLAVVKGQVQELSTNLGLGAEGDDVVKAQEILATDPTIFRVKPTGFFGPITQEAVKRFQTRFGLPVTGVLDEATREAMKQLRLERKDGNDEGANLLTSKEVRDRVKAHLEQGCMVGAGTATAVCMKQHGKEKMRPCMEKSATSTAMCDKGSKMKMEDMDDDEEGDDDEDMDEEDDDSLTQNSAARQYSAGTTTTSTSSKMKQAHKKNASSSVAVLATKTVTAAKVAVVKFTADVAAMKMGSSSASTTSATKNMKLKKVEKKLLEAKRKLADAEKKLAAGKYPGAIQKARQVLKIVAKQEVKKIVASI